MDSVAPPAPVSIGDRLVVPVDITRVEAKIHFDVAARVASVEASVEFVLEDSDGYPALDLRQSVDWLRLDGRDMTGEAFPPSTWVAARAPRCGCSTER